MGTSTASFSGAVNPDGLATTASFQYGLDSRYTKPGTSGPVYDHTTAAQAVGSDFSSHGVLASVSGLVPNAIYHVRLVARNGEGTTVRTRHDVQDRQGRGAEAPVLARSFNVSATGWC